MVTDKMILNEVSFLWCRAWGHCDFTEENAVSVGGVYELNAPVESKDRLLVTPYTVADLMLMDSSDSSTAPEILLHLPAPATLGAMSFKCSNERTEKGCPSPSNVALSPAMHCGDLSSAVSSPSLH